MSRADLGAGLALLAALCMSACVSGTPGTGSKTNWLQSCQGDSMCGPGNACLCGVCTRSCNEDNTCAGLGAARCAPVTSGLGRSLCGTPAPSPIPITVSSEGGASTQGAGGSSSSLGSGLCLPACQADGDCGLDALCLEGLCSPVVAAPCPSAAALDFIAVDSRQALFARAPADGTADGVLQLGLPQARLGTFFADGLYLPVSYDTQPTTWIEPIQPLRFEVLVQDVNRSPVPGCIVTWLTGLESGWAFGDTPMTDADGRVTGRWVAGTRGIETVVAAVAREGQRPLVARLVGEARPQDADPKAAAPLPVPTTVKPVPVYLGETLPTDTDRVSVTATLVAIPPGTFHAIAYLPGMVTGLYNLSTTRVLEEATPENARVVSVAVDRTPELEASVLWTGTGVTCATDSTATYTLNCRRASAWVSGESQTFDVELQLLAANAGAPADYAALGYATTACTSTTGCTDYTVFVKRGLGPRERIAAVRYPQREAPTWLSHYVDPYGAALGANSCLATPRSELLVAATMHRPNGDERLLTGTFSALYNTWHNQPCVNYGAAALGTQFYLTSGGSYPFSAPLMPGGSRSLTLSQ